MSQITTDPARFDIPDRRDLRQLRLIAGLSIREVADRGGWSSTTVLNWEQAHSEPRLSDIETLLDIYAAELDGQQQFAANPAV